MSEASPLVSVVITTYNRRKLVKRAVSSVLSQTYKNLECIIVDDRSTDGTLNSLIDFANKDNRVKIVSHIENRHLSAARNTGIDIANGKYIAFLDDDDVWKSEKLEKQVATLNSTSKNIGIVYCWFDIYRGKEKVGTRRPTLRGNIFKHLLASQPLGNGSTLLVRRDVFKNIGKFDEKIKKGIDGDFIRRVCKYYEIELVPEVLVNYFVGHDRITLVNSLQDINKELKLNIYLVNKFKYDFLKHPYSLFSRMGRVAKLYLKYVVVNKINQ